MAEMYHASIDHAHSVRRVVRSAMLDDISSRCKASALGDAVQPDRRRDEDEFAGLVRSIALKVRAQLDLHGDLDDLIAAGYAGLVEAQSRFDASRGVQFSSFAYHRIRGAMIDDVRKSANLSRRAYAHLKHAEAADLVAEEVAVMRAADPNARKDVEGTVRTLDETLHKITASFVLSCLGQDEDEEQDDPETSLSGQQQSQLLRDAVERLPERERALVVGHYFDGRRFDEVAQELGVSKSWASRIHAKALERLRSEIERG